MQFKPWTWASFAAAALMAPTGAFAQFAAFPFHTFEVRGPNSLNFGRGPRVELGAFGPDGISGTATRDGTESCDGPLSLPINNLGSSNIPRQGYGRYFPSSFSSICTRSWRLTLNVGALQTVVDTQDLIGAQLLPFVSNNSLTSSSDGKVHTFNWSAVPGAKSVTVQIWDRSQMPSQPAQFVSAQSFSGTTTNFGIDLNQPGPYVTGRAYTLEVLQVDERVNAVPSGEYVKALSRSRTYFDFTLPSVPLTTAPVFLPIVEYIQGDPTYTFTVTVDAVGTFWIDPDFAVGYIYQTGAGNPNFRTVRLPNVGDGRYVIEAFDGATGQYASPIAAVAGQTYDFIALGFPQGVSKFRVKGIEASAGLDASNPGAFPTALQFTSAGTFTGTMIPITKYAFSGFLPPINVPPTVNTGPLGRSFPLKWALADAQGAAVRDLGAVKSITYKPSACAPFTTDPTGALPAQTTGGSQVRFDPSSQQYVYNWKSPSTPGCYVVFLTLDSGQVFNANAMLTH